MLGISNDNIPRSRCSNTSLWQHIAICFLSEACSRCPKGIRIAVVILWKEITSHGWLRTGQQHKKLTLCGWCTWCNRENFTACRTCIAISTYTLAYLMGESVHRPSRSPVHQAATHKKWCVNNVCKKFRLQMHLQCCYYWNTDLPVLNRLFK